MDATHDQVVSATFDVTGMNCASCTARVEKAAKSVPGVLGCRVNLATGRAAVDFDSSGTTPVRVADAIAAVGYPAHLRDSGDAGNSEARRIERQAHETGAWFRRAAVGIALWLPVESAHWIGQFIAGHPHMRPAQSDWMGWTALVSSSLCMLYVGRSFYASAWKALKHRTSNMDTLISMGASVAYFFSLVYFIGGMTGIWPKPHSHELYFMEASGLLALISLGHWLEARARQSAGRAIHELMNLAPATALRMKADASGNGDGKSDSFEEVPLARVQVGDHILARPGDRVSADGIVVGGASSVDESMISGEPVPVTRRPGDPVIGGTINQEGRLVIRVTKTGNDTALAQIVKLVENAQSSKPPAQKLADQISAVFVPSVLGIALITAIGWLAWGHGHQWSNGQIAAVMARAVCSVLIIACPCALGLAVPATVMVGSGLGAGRGILIRDIDALQNAERIDTVVLDKTGTLTRGKPVVSKIVPADGLSEIEILSLAAAAEQYSAHPLATAILNMARERAIDIPALDEFNTEAGAGVVARIGPATILVGSDDLLQKHGDGEPLTPNVDRHVGTQIHLARGIDGSPPKWLGRIDISDQLKPDSVAAVGRLHALGLRTMLLTGDNQLAAEQVAKEVGIDHIRAKVKPDGKAAVVREIQNSRASPGPHGSVRRSFVAMVGDGINDAPALAAADLGIAVGGGSDVARETGGIVLVGGSLAGVASSIQLSRATMRKIRQNLFLAFIYNVIAIPFAAFGLVNPLVAAAAMALSDITVIGNALLLRRAEID